MTARPDIITLTGPAAWASYLVNGDASGLEPEERAKADAWLTREGVSILSCEGEEFFSWHARLHAPELDCDGASMVEYVAAMRATQSTRQNETANLKEAREHFAAMLAGRIPLPHGWTREDVEHFHRNAESALKAARP